MRGSVAAVLVLLGICGAARGQQKVRVELAGDSTMTTNAGYGVGFCESFSSAKVECINMAHGGTSTKTYRADGWWDKALAAKPDILLVQFGHNDVPANPPMPRNTTIEEYEANLRQMVTEGRAAGIEVVLVTPLARRYFQPDGTIHDDLDAHAAVMTKVAEEMKVPLIDLHAESKERLEHEGPKAQEEWGATKVVDGKTVPDKTHLNAAGSAVIGRMVALRLERIELRLRGAVFPSVGPVAAPAKKVRKIVLVGDSTVATEGGWGPGFCARQPTDVTCVDLALNGRSSISYINEGAWAKALAEHADVYFIQFGHNDEKPDPKRHTDPDTTFAATLERMIADVKAQGGRVVLLSPLARRTFADGHPSNPTLRKYGDAAARVAEEQGEQFIDLLARSEAYLAKGTQADADAFDATAHADAKAENASAALDRTHLNERGKQVFGGMVAEAWARLPR